MSNILDPIPASNATGPLFVGVDVGGTNIKFGIVDDLGRTIGRSSIPTTSERGPDDAIVRMGQAINGLYAQHGLTADAIAAVGLGTPGMMDIPRGMLLEPPNLPGWRQFPIRDRLAAVTGKQVSFANDANAAAYGEFWVGGGEAYHSIVLLTLGTGVGGGIIIGDLSIDGENSHGSECGHIIIDYQDDARLCSCGHRGHLEAYASATALIRRAEEALNASTRPSSVRQRLADGEELTPLLLGKEAEAGDGFALELILETARYLGVGVVSLMHTIDPGAVILGGAMNFGGHNTPLGRRFLERVHKEVRERAFPTLVDRTVVDFAHLGGHAGYIGAAGIARMHYHKQK
ncbi:MAG TPA: ROK family protein [Pirellulaceae bacterium]|nr:ROK family protein [Pirellulaceae bacterium]